MNLEVKNTAEFFKIKTIIHGKQTYKTISLLRKRLA